MAEGRFDHEKLRVYQEAIAFCAWWEEASHACRTLPTVKDQLDRASTSVPLNIAEGNGKLSPRDRSRYLQSAAGSALECAACLDVIAARGRLAPESVAKGKRRLLAVVSMLTRLIQVTSDRISEPIADYGSGEFDEEP